MLAVGFLAAIAGLDRTAFGQTQFAHPLVVGSAAMLLVGPTPDAAVFLGVLTCLDAARIPVGPVRRPDFSSAALVGVILGSAHESAPHWAIALLVAIAVATIGGWSEELIRGLSRRATAQVDRLYARGDAVALERLHLGLTASHGLRGAFVVLVSIAAGQRLLPWVLELATERTATDFLAGIWAVAPWAALPVLCRLHLPTTGPAFGLLRWGPLCVLLAVTAWFRVSEVGG